MMLDHSSVVDVDFSPSELFLDGRKPRPLKIRKHNLYGSKQNTLVSITSLHNIFQGTVGSEVWWKVLTHLYPIQPHLQHPPLLVLLATSSTPGLQSALR